MLRPYKKMFSGAISVRNVLRTLNLLLSKNGVYLAIQHILGIEQRRGA